MTFSIEQLGEVDRIIGQWCVARVPPTIKNQIENLLAAPNRQMGSLQTLTQRQKSHGRPGHH